MSTIASVKCDGGLMKLVPLLAGYIRKENERADNISVFLQQYGYQPNSKPSSKYAGEKEFSIKFQYCRGFCKI